MTDQYGKKVPTDLVLMPDIKLLSRREIKLVADQDWYECDGILLVSASAIHFLSEADPSEAGIVLSSVTKVNGLLKRWSLEDGWYHA